MNRLLTYTLLLLLTVILPACNEDDTQNDSAYTQQLQGTWLLNVTVGSNDDNKSTTLYTYQFAADKFTYTQEYTQLGGMVTRGYTVSGAWNVRSATIQLNYDVESLKPIGNLTQEEMAVLRTNLKGENANLADQNKKGRAYGYKMQFVDLGGKTGLQLAGFNGYFVRLSL